MHHDQYMGFEGQATFHRKVTELGETGALHFFLLRFKEYVICTLRNR